MDETARLFAEALRCALIGESVPWTEAPAPRRQSELIRLAQAHALLPLLAQAVYERPEMLSRGTLAFLKEEARKQTLAQASRTAEFLLLLDELAARGLRPAVLKGIVCRQLYPEPEQRPSTDEDLLIPAEDLAAYHAALLDCGLQPLKPDEPLEGADEVTYVSDERGLYLELHMRLFPSGSDAYGDCNRLFEGALDRAAELELRGRRIRTLCPTDHLLFLLCHAYKHILHGGVGIRQLCDICLFARHYDGQIDWERVAAGCGELHLERLTAVVFRIGERHLGVPAPASFPMPEIDELPLLEDCLTGGLYGMNDLDRAHSSTMTLEAVAAGKQGRRSRGALHSVFLPARSLEGRFPYLRKRPWLLPVAWTQRVWRYAMDRSSPGKSVSIGRERIELLKRYELIP